MDFVYGALTDAGFGPRIGNLYDDFGELRDVDAFFQLTGMVGSPIPRPSRPGWIWGITGARKAEGTEETFLPGEIESRREKEREASGVPAGRRQSRS